MTLSTISLATLTVPFLDYSGLNPELEKILSTPEILGHLIDSQTIIEIGKVYETKMPDEYTIKKIADLLMRNPEGGSISANPTPVEIHSFIAKNIHADFQSGKTILLQGWVLSISEARQCALYSLIHS